MQILPKIGTVRAKLTITSELLLLSKLSGVTAPKLGRGATAVNNPKEYQGTEDNLQDEVSFYSPHAQDEMLIA